MGSDLVEGPEGYLGAGSWQPGWPPPNRTRPARLGLLCWAIPRRWSACGAKLVTAQEW